MSADPAALPLTAPDAGARRALLVSAMLSFFIMGSGMALFGPTLPVFARDFGLTTVQVSWLVATQWIGCFLGVVAMYFLSQRISPRPALAAILLGLAILALAPVWSLALLGAFVFGLGYGAGAAVFNPRVLLAYGSRGGSMVGLINALFSLGAILAPYAFVALSDNPRPVFGVMAALSALALALSGPSAGSGRAPLAQGKGFRLHLPILVLGFLAIGVEVSLAGLGPTGLIRLGLDEAAAARLLSLYFAMMLISRLILILVADRVPAFALFTFATLWGALCALGVILLGPALCFPAMGISVGLIFQGEYVTALRKMGSDPRVPSVVMGTGLLGAIASPLVYSRLMDRLGDGGLFWLLGGMLAALGLASLALYRDMER